MAFEALSEVWLGCGVREAPSQVMAAAGWEAVVVSYRALHPFDQLAVTPRPHAPHLINARQRELRPTAMGWASRLHSSCQDRLNSIEHVVGNQRIEALARGSCAAAFTAWSCGNLGLQPLVRTSGGFGPRRSDAHRDRSRPRTASDRIRQRGSKGKKLGCGDRSKITVSARPAPPIPRPAQPRLGTLVPSQLNHVRPL